MSGVVLLAVQAGSERRTFVAEMSIGERDHHWVITTGWTGWGRLRSDWTPTGWKPPPTPG